MYAHSADGNENKVCPQSGPIGILLFVVLAPGSAAYGGWSLPLPVGEPHELCYSEGRVFVANGSGGILCLDISKGRLELQGAASTTGNALKVFVEDEVVCAFTSLSNLQFFSKKTLKPAGTVRLGAWNIAGVRLLKRKVF